VENFKEKLVNGFAWQASTKLFVQIISWVSTVWVARLLAPEDYGIVAMSGIVTGIFLLLATTGLAAGVVNRVKISKGELDTVFWLSILMGVALYSVILLIADYAARFYEVEELSDVIKVAGLMVLISSAKIIPASLALRRLDYKLISLNELFGGLVRIVVTLSMAIMGYKYWSLIIGTVAAELVMTIIYFIYYRYAPSLVFTIRSIVDLLRFGVILLFSSALLFVSRNIPLFLLSSFTNTAITGHYQMAHTFGSLPSNKVGLLFSNLIFPAMSRIKNDKILAKNTFIQMHTSLLFVTGPMFIGLALVAEPLINVILTPVWLPIVRPFQAVCIIAIFQMSSLFITRAIEGLGDAKVSLKYQIYFIIICGPAMYVGVYNWGLDGMLAGWLATAPIVYIYLLYKIAKKLDIHLFEMLKMYLPLGLCLSLMCLSVLLLQRLVFIDWSHLQQLILAFTSGSVVFCVSAYFFDRQYVIKIKRIILKAFNKGNRRAT
jgi:O-antigen/teichoic acid export membrane protein